MGVFSCCFPKASPRQQFSDAAAMPAPAPKAAAPPPQQAPAPATQVPPALPVMPQAPAVPAPVRQGVNNMNGGGGSPFVPSLNTNAAIEVVEKDFARQAAREKKKQEEAAKKADAKAAAKAAAMGIEYTPPSKEENGAEHGAHQQPGGASKPNGPEVLVNDGDPKCKAGQPVMVAQKWLSVPYFQQFQGLTGTLTRRGVSGVTWYAQFPGLFEQAFSTGMHGQYVLCYAPDEGPQKKERKHKKGSDKNPIAPPPRANKTHSGPEPPMSSAVSVTSAGGYKQRPGTARSRAAMGAPPLNSHRSMGPLKSARYSVVGSMKDGNMTNRDNPKQGRMFKYPEWDEYELFDSDDLWSEHVYVLYGEHGPGGGAKVYVWIGQYNEYCDYNQNASCKSLAEKAVAEFRAHVGGWPVASISFVKELKETEEFWDYFLLG